MTDRPWSSFRVALFPVVIGLLFVAMPDARAEPAGHADPSPRAVRTSPGHTLSPRQAVRMNHVFTLYNDGRRAEALAAADRILADDAASALEKAKAAQVAAQAAFGTGQPDAAINYYEQAIGLDVLDNDAHFGAMRNLALLQQQQQQLADSAATYERFFTEGGSPTPRDLVSYGHGLYLAERYAEAAVAIEQAINASAAPDSEWQALLVQAQMKAGKSEDALRVAEQVAAGSPDDPRAQRNLAAIYQRNAMPEQAAAVLEKLRSNGQFRQAADYRQLASIYIGMEGHAPQAIEVVCTGLEDGMLEPDFKTLEELARLYFLSQQFDASIDTLGQIAPLDPSGDTYLDLAGLLWEKDRRADAQVAAREALARGLADPDDALNARNILTYPVPEKGAAARRGASLSAGSSCVPQRVEVSASPHVLLVPPYIEPDRALVGPHLLHGGVGEVPAMLPVKPRRPFVADRARQPRGLHALRGDALLGVGQQRRRRARATRGC